MGHYNKSNQINLKMMFSLYNLPTCLGAEQNCTQVRFFLSKLVEASAACQERRSKMYPGTGTLGKETPPPPRVMLVGAKRRLVQCSMNDVNPPLPPA